MAYYDDPSPAKKNDALAHYKRLVIHLARKMTFDVNHLDDMIQVGMIGLLKAIERFDRTQDTAFVSFAIPTIIGEMRHYLRDRLTIIRLPRSVQETHQKIKKYVRTYTQTHEKSPTVAHIATELGLSQELVLECYEINQVSSPLSLDSAAYDDGPARIDSLVYDEGHDQTQSSSDYDSMHAAISTLSERDQTIIRYRFYEGLSQQEIADKLNLSQMHVSRLLRKSLAKLKKSLTDA